MRTPIRYRWVIEPVDARVARAQAPVGEGRWAPPADVFETDASYIIELDVPGVAPESVELTFEAGELTVSGERQPTGEGTPLRRERPMGGFRRVLQLADGIAADRIRASAAIGVLRLEVRLAETARPRRIPVLAGAGAEA
jgi:HSP20 family protein